MNQRTIYLWVIFTLSSFLIAIPVTGWALDLPEPEWVSLGLEGHQILVIGHNSHDVVVGAMDGLHVLDYETHTWLDYSSVGPAGWPVTAFSQAPNYPDILLTGRLDPDNRGALVITQVSDGTSEVSLGDLPGPVSQMGHTEYWANYRVWACIPGETETGKVFKTGSGGEVWAEITGHGFSHPNSFATSPIVVDREIVAQTILAGDGPLQATTDNGETFAPIHEDLPGGEAKTFLISPSCVAIPAKSRDSCEYLLATTEAGLYLKDETDGPWQLILTQPCQKVMHVASLTYQRICVLTEAGTLLGAERDENSAWIWEDWGADLEAFQIVDFEYRGSILLVGTAANGVFSKTFPWGSTDVPNLSDEWRFSVAPNPFNPITTFSLEAPQAGLAELTIFDIRGRKVETVFHEDIEAGPHDISWQPRNLTSGIYLAQLKMAGKTSVQRVVLIR